MSILNKLRTSDADDSSTRGAAIMAGVLFLTATVTFLIGDMLIADFFAAPAEAARGTLAVGVALQAVCALACAGIGLVLLKVLSRHSTALANGYLAFRCIEAVVIIAIGIRMLSTQTLVQNHEILIYGFTGVAGLMLSYLLHKADLVPQWLAWLGIVGYVAILLAIPATLTGIATLDSGMGMVLYVPGGLFELFLPILLIARGFRRPSAPVAPPAARRGLVSA